MSQRVYSNTIKYGQVTVTASPAVTVDLPPLAPLTIRRMTVKISGWRIDGADDDTPYLDNGFVGSREVWATRGAVTGTPSSYPATEAVVLVLPTQITAQAGDTFGPCDGYDAGAFGTTPNGLSPLAVTYVPGAGGTGGAETAGRDQLSFVFDANTADQNLAMTLLVSYEDQPIVLT